MAMLLPGVAIKGRGSKGCRAGTLRWQHVPADDRVGFLQVGSEFVDIAAIAREPMHARDDVPVARVAPRSA